MMERKPCRRCLLQDIDESQLMEAIQQRIAALPASQRASAEDYAARLSECRMCDFLVSGTCQKCGCYVELRAAKRSAYCPHEKPRW
ncbi:MAG TPA: hypothetical protein DHW32_04425 [Ruminococcaceae bacterium]|nr:hypothetical protein [Eubacterium sp.]HBM31731.1 hypothetical protein [Oscillospiraceae bacterium]HCK49959.1 hypothetical protein [Oscillospiraceae bacterium]